MRYRSGDHVTCANCGEIVTVTVFDGDTIEPIAGTSMHDVVLQCQSCEAVLCNRCSTPPAGSGMAFCPICKTAGGPFLITG